MKKLRARMKPRKWTLIFVLALIGAQTSAWADDTEKPIIAITPQTDLATLQTKAAISLQTAKGVTVLKLVGPAKMAFPGIHYAPATPLDLSAFKGVEAEVTNQSDEAIGVSMKVENDTDPKAGHWSVGSVQLAPGDTRILQALFGQSYGKPGYALDPARIVGITLYISGSSDHERTLLIKNIQTFTQIKLQQPADIGKPPMDGLVLWLDPSKADTLTADAGRHISLIADRSGQHHDAKAASIDAQPLINPLEARGRPMMHFDTKTALKIDAIRAAPGGVSVFIVYSKTVGKLHSLPDGNLIASIVQPALSPKVLPNFCIAVPDAKAAWKFGQFIAVDHAPIGPIAIGQGYAGDIGEVLVYDHVFATESERRRVIEYLYNKWNVTFPEPGWVRDGPLDPIPPRTHEDLPLSDQSNTGHWTLDPKFTDEFDETAIDPNRYEVFCTNSATQWPGRMPGAFVTDNTYLKDGSLHIKLDKIRPDQMKGRGGYKYTTGYMQTRERTGYGYYEIQAKPARAEFDNAFWFSNTGDPKNGLEIDVFEMGPHTKDYHNKDVMTAHVWGENGDGRHWGSLVAYTTPWDTADAFHTYGLLWTRDDLIWYIDGSPVRKLKNTNWHLPQKMIFDCEPMVDWFGPIDDSDFPAEFNIKYVRVWRQANT